MFLAAVFLVAVVSGATASIAGFGIGSLLTPLLATQFGMETAVAAVAVPHAAATTLRWWRLRHAVDRAVIRRFGLLSAAGGLAGALLYARFSGRTITLILGLLLIVTSVAAITEWNTRWTPHGWVVSGTGLLSGLFGGLAGNQGGLRAAAMLSFSLTPIAYVATSTATGLLVDVARTPIYLWRAGPELLGLYQPLGVATVGVLIGTLLGERVLLGIPPKRFRMIVGAVIGALGVWIVAQAVSSAT
ncbi:MAG: TSUP family transporter [Gemmatimonadetes bacterium]|nr:TSUP family transporter [Gemmatimonadota bacterium]